MKIKQPKNDLEGIMNEDFWPNWPILPLKRKRKDEFMGIECGIIYALFSNKTILLTNMFILPKTWEELINLKKYEYNSVEEMLEDGWIID